MFSDSLFLSIPNSYKFRTLPIQKTSYSSKCVSTLYTTQFSLSPNSRYSPSSFRHHPRPNTSQYQDIYTFFVPGISYSSSKYFPVPNTSQHQATLCHTAFFNFKQCLIPNTLAPICLYFKPHSFQVTPTSLSLPVSAASRIGTSSNEFQTPRSLTSIIPQFQFPRAGPPTSTCPVR